MDLQIADALASSFFYAMQPSQSGYVEGRYARMPKTVSDAGQTYATQGKHTLCVKVVDVFGCDTSITVDVNA